MLRWITGISSVWRDARWPVWRARGARCRNSSGDYVIAFATPQGADRPRLSNNRMSPLFQAVIEATEEAIYNSLFLATSVTGHRGSAEALPLAETIAILKRYGVIRP
jgi:D-aminopeptidase